jgi:hypothetical protein
VQASKTQAMNFVFTRPKKTKPPPELQKNQGPNKHKEYRKLCFLDSDRRLTYDPGCGKESVDRSIARSPHKHSASSLQAESGQLFLFFS